MYIVVLQIACFCCELEKQWQIIVNGVAKNEKVIVFGSKKVVG